MAFRGRGTIIVSTAAPTASVDIGDAFVTGGSGLAADAQHQHAFPAPSAGYVQDLAAVGDDGADTTPARARHRHRHRAVDHSPGGFADLSTVFAARTGPTDTTAAMFVQFWGAVGDGVADDTAAIQAAIDHAAITGGPVLFLPATYLVSASITLKSGVRLIGWAPPMGYGNTNPITGAVIAITGTGYDVIVTPSGSQVRGSGIEDLGFTGSTGAANWTVHVYDAVGFILRNLAFRQATDGANGIFLEGNTSGVYQTIIDNLSLNCGLGHVGGTALKFGGAGANALTNYNVGRSVAAVGYATGVDFNHGAGNTLIGVWTQFCTVGIRFGATICVVKGGWSEQNGTAFVFTSTSTGNVLEDVRNAGGHSVALCAYDGTKNTVRVNDFPAVGVSTWKASAHPSGAQSIPDSTTTLVALPVAVANLNDGNFDTGASTYTAPAAGTYRVSGRVELVSAATRCIAQVFKNGAEALRGGDGPNASSEVGGLMQLAKGDVVDLRCFQVSGGALNTVPGIARTFLDTAFVSF